jgi:hypothetical protein
MSLALARAIGGPRRGSANVNVRCAARIAARIWHGDMQADVSY